ncbi:unnamed protein product, partial [Nesidiocoris tenuis]
MEVTCTPLVIMYRNLGEGDTRSDRQSRTGLGDKKGSREREEKLKSSRANLFEKIWICLNNPRKGVNANKEMSNNNNLPKIRADPPPWITLSITYGLQRMKITGVLLNHPQMRRDDFLIIGDLLRHDEFNNISLSSFIWATAIYVVRIATISWVDLKCELYWDLIGSLSFIISQLSDAFVLIQYCTALSALKLVLSRINGRLTTQHELVDLFEEALNICHIVNNLYGPQMLLTIGQTFAITLSYSYNALDMFSCNTSLVCVAMAWLCTPASKLVLFSYQVSNVLFVLYFMFLIVRRCGSIVDENPTFEKMGNRMFASGLLTYLWRFVTVCWLDVMCRMYTDLALSTSFLFFNLNEFVIVIQFCTVLRALRHNVASATDNLYCLQKSDFRSVDRALELGEKVDRLYGIQILLIISQIFLIVVSYSLTLVQMISCSKCSFYTYICTNNGTNYPMIAFCAGGIFSAVFVLTIILHCCQSTAGQVERFNKSIFKIMKASPSLANN